MVPAATIAIGRPAATRARGIGNPGTLTEQTATSSRLPLIGRQSPDTPEARRRRSFSSSTSGRNAPAAQMP